MKRVLFFHFYVKIKKMENFKKLKLKNNLRVLLVPQSFSLATTVIVLVAAGSAYENKKTNGLSHFLEHMCFKGTKKRPHPIDIALELDGLGAQYNAFTSREFTSYYAKAKNQSFEQILEIISDLYLNPIFEPKEIETERGVIIEEINMYEDTPAKKVQEVFNSLLYGDQPAGWSIAGRKQNIKRFQRDDFLAYRKKHYVSSATLLVISGGFEEKNILEKISSYFRFLPQGPKKEKPKTKEFQTKPQALIKFKDSDQTHLILGFRAFSIFDKRRFALEVLANILGGGMSSRLFQKIREEMGAAYYVNALTDLNSDCGSIFFAAGVDHQKVDLVIKSSLEEFKKIKDRGVDKKELKKAKEHLIGHLFLSLESSDEIGYFYGSQEILGLKILTPSQWASKIQAVEADEIRNLALNLFKNKNLNLALIGPFKNKNFQKILEV